MCTDVGEVRITVPRDRAGAFTSVVVPKHARRLAGFDDAVLSLYAKGMTTGDIAHHLADVKGPRCLVTVGRGFEPHPPD